MLLSLCSLVLALPVPQPLAQPALLHGAAYPPVPPPGLPDGVPPNYRPTPEPAGGRTGTPPTGGPATPGVPGSGAGPATTPGPSGPSLPSGGGGGYDPNSWKHWWHFRGAEYLNLRERVHSRSPLTEGDDFSLGEGERTISTDLAPPAELVVGEVLPFLEGVLDEESRGDLLTAGLLALAKVAPRGGPEAGARAAEQLLARLKHPNQEASETAAVGLGLLGDPAQLPMLLALAQDSPRGRKLVGSTEVPYRTRAFAVYALGLLGRAAQDQGLCRQIGQHLVGLVEGPGFSTRDLKVAAVLALGLLPLDDVAQPPSGDPLPGAEHVVTRRALCGYLLEVLRPDRASAQRHPDLVRAHSASSLARQLRGAPESLTALAIEECTERIGRFSKETEEVQASCTIALGHLLRAGSEKLHSAGRTALWAAVERGDASVRRYALIALGRSASRPGKDGLAATAKVRKRLRRTLDQGKTTLQPWAALSLGVLADGLHDRGVEPDLPAADSLVAKLSACRRPEDVGAYALACAIAKAPGSGDVLLEKLTFFSDWEAQGYLSIALGLTGSREALGPVTELVEASRFRPELLWRASVGLALLGDKQVVPLLTGLLETAPGSSTQAALSTALGWIGDHRSVHPLLNLAKNRRATEGARAYAVVALGLVCDPRKMPWTHPLAARIDYQGTTLTLTGSGTGLLDML